MSREENVKIFEDTKRLVKSERVLSDAVKKQTDDQKLILESDEIAAGKSIADLMHRYEEAASVRVSQKRSFEAASAYREWKTCVHNFASSTNPGGGVVKGSSAQEECLCRCSTLYFSLNTQKMWDGFYTPHRQMQNPLHNGDIIYTPGVYVFKTDTANPRPMPQKDWYQVNVITCAAPNLRQRPGNSMNPGDGKTEIKLTEKELLAIHEQRLSRLLDVALAEENEVVILGAFGCGAFENDPRVVARASKNVIEKYLHAFRFIEFAVYCSPRDDTNYRIFENTMRNLS